MLNRVVLLSLLAVVASAGCGGSKSSSKASYERAMAAIAPTLQGQMLKRRFALEETRVPVLARRMLLRTEHELRTGIARVRAAKPPADIASNQHELIAGYRTELAELNALEPLTQKTTTDQFRVAAGKLSRAPGVQQVAAALHAIIAKGYDLGFPAGS